MASPLLNKIDMEIQAFLKGTNSIKYSGWFTHDLVLGGVAK